MSLAMTLDQGQVNPSSHWGLDIYISSDLVMYNALTISALQGSLGASKFNRRLSTGVMNLIVLPKL